MKKILLWLAAWTAVSGLVVVYAAGNTAQVSWTAPTTYNDGSPLPASDIDHYSVAWIGIAGAQGPGPSGTMTVKGSASAISVPVACGSVNFAIVVTTTATAKYPNTTSDPSGAVPYATGLVCKPNPPGAPAAR